MGDHVVPTSRTENQREIEMMKNSEEIKVLLKPQRFSCDPNCGFSEQAKHASESELRSKSATKLCRLICFYLIFMVVEIVGGTKANSLAVLTDAAHLLTDVAGFSISLFAIWASGWEATPRQSFGFFRLEVLGALLSVQLIWLISGILIYEAIDRILHKSATVNGKLMFVIAAFGFFINLVMVVWLGHDHTHGACGDKDHDHGREDGCPTAEEEKNLISISSEEPQCEIEHNQLQNHRHNISGGKTKTFYLNMNLQGAYLHVMTDLIQSIGVMIAGAVIWAKPDWLVVDLLCTLSFSVLVLCTTLAMLTKIFHILMESTPNEIDIAMLESGLKCVEGVSDVHDLHVWAITTERIALACHVTAEPSANSNAILLEIRDYCKKKYRIHHATIQIEQE
ncbi:hypothetical protein HHK36_011088 [Tetracentron sinense]|uniref:Uncharacterized protein n=1 Tax=Tetracentron sinense TaxID=13715 RepID=A0A835DK49_TETSI|nr:hypothetical protein HHK36_011088 [Tetracentron sinense]